MGSMASGRRRRKGGGAWTEAAGGNLEKASLAVALEEMDGWMDAWEAGRHGCILQWDETCALRCLTDKFKDQGSGLELRR
mmetsp:Transcript_23399/g.41940  ORF Transcript_23399/g.41940 Transcript_23399/m.41940 type:complete len:80 (-) Transcript_23399:99-338(-)